MRLRNLKSSVTQVYLPNEDGATAEEEGKDDCKQSGVLLLRVWHFAT